MKVKMSWARKKESVNASARTCVGLVNSALFRLKKDFEFNEFLSETLP